MTTFEQTFDALPLSRVHDLAAEVHAQGWRYVQILAVNTEDGVDLVYSYMQDGHLANFTVSGVKAGDVVPSITDLYLEAFVCENEIHDLFDVAIEGIAIDFGGMFYQLAEKAPMTIVSPEKLAAQEKARKVAAAKAAKEAKAAAEKARAAEAPDTAAEAPAAVAPDAAATVEPAPAAQDSAEADVQAKIASLDAEKAARVKAALLARAKKAAAEALASKETAAAAEQPEPAEPTPDPAPEPEPELAAAEPSHPTPVIGAHPAASGVGLTEEEIQARIAGLEPEKAAKVRMALLARAKKAAAETNEKGE